LQAPDLQQAIFDLAKASLGTKQVLRPFLAFLGKKAGPKAAWFLLNIDLNCDRKNRSY
jgi:lysyl-tRNA synthetase class I